MPEGCIAMLDLHNCYIVLGCNIHAPERSNVPVSRLLRHGGLVGKDGEIPDNETTDPDRLLARRVEELRQLALLNGSDGRREVLDPEIVHEEAVKRLERADAEEATADAFGAEVGKGNVADVVVYVGGVGVGLIRLRVQLVEADEGRVAAIRGIARVNDINVGDKDVFESPRRPAELHRWGCCALPNGDALDGDIGVIGFDRVVVGVIEYVLDCGPWVVLQTVCLSEESADLLVV